MILWKVQTYHHDWNMIQHDGNFSDDARAKAAKENSSFSGEWSEGENLKGATTLVHLPYSYFHSMCGRWWTHIIINKPFRLSIRNGGNTRKRPEFAGLNLPASLLLMGLIYFQRNDGLPIPTTYWPLVCTLLAMKWSWLWAMQKQQKHYAKEVLSQKSCTMMEIFPLKIAHLKAMLRGYGFRQFDRFMSFCDERVGL